MKQDILKLAKGSLIYGSGHFLNQFINVLLLPVFTAFLTPKDYGILSILNLVAILLTALFSLGLGVSIGICYFEQTSAQLRIRTIWSAFGILLLSSIVLLTLGLWFAKSSSHFLFNSTSYETLIKLNFLNIALGMLSSPFIYKLQFEERQIDFVIVTLFSTLSYVILAVILVIFQHQGVYGMLVSLVISKILTLFLVVYKNHLPRQNIWPHTAFFRTLIINGLPMVPAYFCLYTLQKGNNLILQKVHSLDIAGIYSVGADIGSSILILVSAFLTAWTPFFLSFSNRQEEGKTVLSRVLTYYIYCIGIVSLLYYIFSKLIILVFTKPPFHGASQVIGLTASSQFLLGIFSILLPPVYFAKEVRFVTFIQLLAVCCFFLFSFLITPHFSIQGAAIALLLGYFLMILLLFFWNKSQHRRYLNIVYEWHRIYPFAIMYLIFIVFMTCHKSISDQLEFLISLILFFTLIIGTYKLLSVSEKNHLKKFLPFLNG